jgi:hypothetical protein
LLVPLPRDYRVALGRIVSLLPVAEVNWALTGSTSHALQGVPVEPNDIDVQCDEAGTWAAASALASYCVSPPRRVESEWMRSLLGQYRLGGLKVEIIGAVQKRLGDGAWGLATDPSEHRILIDLGGLRVPVLTLHYDAAAYEAIGRRDRAELLRRFIA